MNYQYYISYNGPHFVIFGCYFVKFWLDLSLLSIHFHFVSLSKVFEDVVGIGSFLLALFSFKICQNTRKNQMRYSHFYTRDFF